MLKKLFAMIMVLLLAASLLAACGGQESEGSGSQGEEGQNLSAVQSGDLPSGMPSGFPASVPIYENAEIIEADTYGEDGFTVVYSVNDSYENVVGFYMMNIDGMDESGIGEDEAYFEGMDIGDVHINGLTISDADGKTQVFITLRDYGNAASGSGEGDEEEYYEEEEDGSKMSYEDSEEVALDSRYPADIVPIYPEAKVIDCSLAPSGSGFVELVLPSGAYEDAVSFYADELGLSPKNSDSEIMKSESFKGDIDGWRVSLQVAQIKVAGNDPMISITVDK